MVAGPAFDDAVARARACPELATGLHLVLCDGRAASAASRRCRGSPAPTARFEREPGARGNPLLARAARAARPARARAARAARALPRERASARPRRRPPPPAPPPGGVRRAGAAPRRVSRAVRAPRARGRARPARAAAPARPGARDLRGALAARAPARGAGRARARPTRVYGLRATRPHGRARAAPPRARPPRAERRDLLPPEPRERSRAAREEDGAPLGGRAPGAEGRRATRSPARASLARSAA